MAAGATVEESQLQRIIRDLHDAVAELAKEYGESGEPITDDSTNLHKFANKLEYLLQFDQKEKTTFLGIKKDYWDYFNDSLAKIKGANDGIRFVKSIKEVKTSLGKGRAFIRYSLVHQRLADTLQQCLMNQRVTSDWYYARSPFLKPHLSVDIINHLYELNEVQFDVASRGHDLDAAWPTFARRTLGLANSPGHVWKLPSRSSSINSLASTYSQQASEFLSSPDYSQGLLNDLNESLLACREDASTVEELHLELDQSELKQRELLDKVQQLGEEADELRGVVIDLQKQLEESLTAQENQQAKLKDLHDGENALLHKIEALSAEEKAREEKLTAAEGKNIELMAKLDGFLNEKGQQAASSFDSAQKIHELLDRLKESEKRKMEAVAEMQEKRRYIERLEDELRVKEAHAKESQTKLTAEVTSLSEEKTKLEEKVETQSSTLNKLLGDLTLKEKEGTNLQRQLQDLQRSLEDEEKAVEEMKRKAKDDKDQMQKNVEGLKVSLKAEVAVLADQLERKDIELATNRETVQQVEAKNQSLTTERDKLTSSITELESNIKDQATKIADYKRQCANLMEQNDKLLTTVKKNEELEKEMTENRTVLEAELAALRASEKQLRGQLDDTKISVDEKEKKLREENCNLDESLQKAIMAAKFSETNLKKMEQENQSLKEERDMLKAAQSILQADLMSTHGQNEELEKKLGVSLKNEANLKEKLQAKNTQLENKEKDLIELQSRIKALEEREKELENAKATAEATCARQTEVIERVTSEKKSMEATQHERSAVQAKENQEVTSKLNMVEGQLEVNMKEVLRLQTEVLNLKVQAQRSEEEKLKSQAQLEVTESQRDELRTLTEQLKSQAEAQNQGHVAELVECKNIEKVLTEERDRDKAAHAELVISAAAIREELSTLKAEHNSLTLEHSETREGLHRANTEMAELGMTICKLNAEKEEARKLFEGSSTMIEDLEKEVERLGGCLKELQLENNSLREELTQKDSLPGTIEELKEQLEKTRSQLESIKDSSREEMEAVKFQMSSESMNHQTQIKSLNEQLKKAKAQLEEEQRIVSSLQDKVAELEAVNEQYLQLTGEKDAYITKTEATMRENEGQIQQLRDVMTSSEEAQLTVQKMCEELNEKLRTAEADRQNQFLKMTTEIDDLNRTKANLEERLIELLRDKDALWQKSDDLEFQQRLRAEERWWLMDREVKQCPDCQRQFGWLLRRHHCRLCGRIFCYYCSNNYVMAKDSGKKERCCNECYTQHYAVTERFTKAELSPSDVQPPPPGAGSEPPPEPAPYIPTPRVTVSDPSNRSEDGAFDIITEEEVNSVYDSDAASLSTGGSQEGEQDQCHPGGLDMAAGDLTPEEDHNATVQDSELNLLKSGEVTMAVSLSLDDIAHFGDSSRELFIKSGCYSVTTVSVDDSGPTISWMFSSEPKSVSFSVVYRESSDTQVEQSKVLIPLTRCDSHKETIQGQLKVQHPGLYLLIFDNSFSRFISKKVVYHLTMENPIIYDGSDCS